jgi:hypothetical protein
MSTPAASTNSEASAKQVLAAAAASGDTSAPHPELNGQLLQLPGQPAVYLVLNAFRCWVPDPTTFNNLFNPGTKPILDPNIGLISAGTALTSGAMLAKGTASATVYLLTYGVKMGIPSGDVFNAYHFNWSAIQTFPQIVIDSIPTGPNVDGPHPIDQVA